MSRLARLVILLWFAAIAAAGQDWKSWGNDAGGSRFSTLAQINRTNVRDLRRAWAFHTGEVKPETRNFSPARIDAFESTPLVVDGTMYVPTPLGQVIALDAESGTELWRFDSQAFRPLFRTPVQIVFLILAIFLILLVLPIWPTHFKKAARFGVAVGVVAAAGFLIMPWNSPFRVPRSSQAHRGVAFWESTNGVDRRLLFGTFEPGMRSRLIELDARTGKLRAEFGDRGSVDLRTGVAERWPKAMYANTSPPSIYKNLIIIGAEVPESPSVGPSGDVRAFDIYTGKLVWTFHTIPRPGETGNSGWQPGAWKDRTGGNVWSIMSVDVERGIVFLPIGSASPDFYGGDRKGPDLFANCLVALDAATGKLIWYYQMVHHDLWDYDLPAQPVLATVRRDGKQIPAVIQITKMGLVFILDRLTGAPLFPVEERPVAASDTPGESAWPTQPFPVKPAALSSQAMIPDSGRALDQRCTEMLKSIQQAGMYVPPGQSVTLQVPGEYGGGNWSGGSLDPTTNSFFVNTNNLFSIGFMQSDPGNSTEPFTRTSPWGEHAFFWDNNQVPCQAPPWGLLSSIDLNSGNISWQVPLGNPGGKGAATGAPNLGGSIATAGGVVFIGATVDATFRAFDSATGIELWSAKLPADAHATPVTYWGKSKHKQYVAVAAGGGGNFMGKVSDEVVAFALPD